jgi:spore coat protein U-like protein
MTLRASVRSLLAAAAFAALAFAAPAAAQTTATFQVSATVIARCNITATNITFPSYDVFDTNDTPATGTVQVNCTRGSAYHVGLDNGANFSGGRRMRNGTEYLNYSLFSDAGHSVGWTTTATVDGTIAATYPRTPNTHTVYALIPALQDVPPGTYTDSVIASVNL